MFWQWFKEMITHVIYHTEMWIYYCPWGSVTLFIITLTFLSFVRSCVCTFHLVCSFDLDYQLTKPHPLYNSYQICMSGILYLKKPKQNKTKKGGRGLIDLGLPRFLFFWFFLIMKGRHTWYTRVVITRYFKNPQERHVELRPWCRRLLLSVTGEWFSWRHLNEHLDLQFARNLSYNFN